MTLNHEVMEKIVFKANGQELSVEEGMTVSTFLADRAIEPRTVAIEMNGVALLRSEWSTRKLRGGDRLEVIRVVAGG